MTLPAQASPDLILPVAVSTTAGVSTRVLTWTVVVLAAVIAGLSMVLVGTRVRRELRERRRARLSREPRRLLLECVADPDDARAARLLALSPAQWRALEPAAVALLGKLRGEARDSLVQVFVRRGTVQRALADLRGRSPATRARAAQTLGMLARPETADRVVELLTDPEPFVRVVAVRALGALRESRTVPALLRALEDGAPRHLVADALSRLGPAGLPALHEALTGTGPPVRATVSDALALIGSPSSVAPIAALLRDGDDHDGDEVETRLAAIRALGRIGHPSALGPLREFTRPGTPRSLRVEAIRATGAIGTAPGSADLSELVHDGDPLIAHEAAQALRRIGPAGVVHLERIAGHTGLAGQPHDAGRPGARHAAEALALARIDASLDLRRAAAGRVSAT